MTPEEGKAWREETIKQGKEFYGDDYPLATDDDIDGDKAVEGEEFNDRGRNESRREYRMRKDEIKKAKTFIKSQQKVLEENCGKNRDPNYKYCDAVRDGIKEEEQKLRNYENPAESIRAALEKEKAFVRSYVAKNPTCKNRPCAGIDDSNRRIIQLRKQLASYRK